MNIKEIQRVIEQLEELYAAAGAVGPAKDLKSVSRMLDGHGDKSIEDFVFETKALLAGENPRRREIEVDTDAVEIHSKNLLSAANDPVRFDASFAEIESDARIGRLEWAAIANRFLNAPTNGNYTYKFKSIKDARRAIRDAFIERFEADCKQGIIKRLTQWAS